MKTILHVIDTTGPGGAETVFVELVAGLRKRGYECIALIRGPGWVNDELLRQGVKPLVIDCKGSFNVGYLMSLIRVIRTHRIDLIQSHLLGSNVYCSLAGFLTGTPVISTFHGVVDVGEREKFKFVKFFIINVGSGVVAVTNRLRDVLVQSTPLWERKVCVVYNGIDIRRFAVERNAGLRTQLGLPAASLLLGALGNIRQAKAYPIAIDAVKKLVDAGVDAHLAIAGDGKGRLLNEIQQLCKNIGVENRVHLLGFVKDAPGFLASIDVFVLSSDSEGHPLALTQAMAAGLPIVATRCGVEEIIEHGVTGWVVDKGRSDLLAEGIMTLLADPALARLLSDRAREQAYENYDIEVMMSAYCALYESRLGPVIVRKSTDKFT